LQSPTQTKYNVNTGEGNPALPQDQGTAMAQTDTIVESKTNLKEAVKEPPMFKLIYLNDNQTSMEFVIETLVEFFEYTPTTAHDITLDIHESGSATVAVLPYELAEQKGIEITLAARSQNYPLQIKIEAES
jgi:ATP-dependent Clp protease adaptor protein ClpS